ncbi:MAG: Crp/Fnr family transcriptional regulator [Anaerolineales bacterium]
MRANELAQHISEKEVFRQFPEPELELLAEHAIQRRLRAEEYLCRQDEVWPFVIFVHTGQLRWVMLSLGGREYQLFMLDPKDIFWAHSIFDDQPMPASLQAVGEVEVSVWSKDVILPLLKKNPEAMWEIPRKLTRIMRTAREIIYGLAFQPVAGRLARFLLDSLEGSHQETLERDMTLEDMASTLATSPEVVCRLLYQFQSDEVIDITRTRITLKDRDALKKLIEIS